MTAGIKPAQIAVESGITTQHLTAWLNGGDGESVILALLAWREEIERDAKEREGGFIMTPTARKIIKAFDNARQPKSEKGNRGIALVYGASGVGKTETAQWYENRHNDHGYMGSRS